MARGGTPRVGESSQPSCSKYTAVIRSPNPQPTLSKDPFLVRVEAPLELLSPLSVVRILLGLNIVIWALATLLLHTSSVKVPAVAFIVASAVLIWLILEVVHRLDTRWLVVVLTVSLDPDRPFDMGWFGNSSDLRVPPVGHSGGNHCGALPSLTEPCLGQQLVLGCRSRSLDSQRLLGFVKAAVVALAVGLVDLSTSITVCFLTQTSRRQRSFDNDTGLPNGVGLSSASDHPPGDPPSSSL